VQHLAVVPDAEPDERSEERELADLTQLRRERTNEIEHAYPDHALNHNL
jgi:hypothetical protein